MKKLLSSITDFVSTKKRYVVDHPYLACRNGRAKWG